MLNSRVSAGTSTLPFGPEACGSRLRQIETAVAGTTAIQALQTLV